MVISEFQVTRVRIFFKEEIGNTIWDSRMGEIRTSLNKIPMKLALVLHIYQPPTQYDNVLERITNQCYRPLLSLLISVPEAQISFNVPASLVELWHKNLDKYADIFKLFGKLAERGQIELLGSAAYHPLLFKLPQPEVFRQIKINEQINKELLHGFSSGGGFFPPELALDSEVLDIVDFCGYEWVISESPLHIRSVENEDYPYVLRAQGLDLGIVFRNKSLSLDFAFSRISSVGELLSKEINNPIVALDGETFGWHRKDGLDLLKAMFEDNALSFCLVSDLVKSQLPAAPEFKLDKISWGTRGSNAEGVYYPRWENPQNKVHTLQWELTELAIRAVEESKYNFLERKSSDIGSRKRAEIESDRVGYPTQEDLLAKEKQWLRARHLLDKSLHSDQYFWADGEHVWHLGMVERGAGMLRNVVCSLPDVEPDVVEQANTLYDKITRTGERLFGESVRD